MNIEQARFNMIEQQIRPWDVLDPQVLDLLFVVKREEFVPAAYRNLAFADMEIPLADGQQMLAPKIEAKMLQEVGVRKTDKVLEIGTGSGYMAALLAARAEHVITIENRPDLAATARQNLAAAGVNNVTVQVGDGLLGWAASAPYDVIVLSGSVDQIPAALLKQLRPGGRLVAVVGQAPVMETQLLTHTADGIFNTVNLFETVIPALDSTQQPNRFTF